ncbi:hypothetical protein HK104_003488 [Borealophlyctis nickersoniae]|nr:hypothetical protein HK104_003488 [Borealophlyctis nickersoniae]
MASSMVLTLIVREDGLINYSEYLVFLCLLGTPEYHWKISFKLLDVNGDGAVDKEEFERIMATHTDGLGALARLGNKERRKVNVGATGMNHLFFGMHGEKKLTYDEFIDTISMKDFGTSIISYASPKHLDRLVQRVKELPEFDERISFQQFYDFDHMVRTRFHDLGQAYKVYTAMGSGFKQEDFRRIVAAVTRTTLTPGQVNLIFEVFDTNRDGHLDIDEFYNQVIQGRRSRGLSKPRDTDVGHYMSRVWNCIKDPESQS